MKIRKTRTRKTCDTSVSGMKNSIPLRVMFMKQSRRVRLSSAGRFSPGIFAKPHTRVPGWKPTAEDDYLKSTRPRIDIPYQKRI